jgi:GrpB-like predicted nucleotidyltransferase (UPF0157 family)
MLTGMPIGGVEYDAGWPAAFVIAAEELTGAISQTLVALHHIGSTSILNMWGKPVIDMLAVVDRGPGLASAPLA